MAYTDENLLFGEDQAVTASAASTNVIDLGAGGTGDAGVEILINVSEAATAAGAATVTISIETDDNDAFSSAATVYTSTAIAKATLVAGYEALKLKLPRISERYVRVYYTVATGPLTAGKFTAALVLDNQTNL